MASSKRRIPTYHVVPHFNIAATGGALRLGTVVKDLVELVPLNRKEADIIVGFRIKKYRYRKKSLFSKERKLEGHTVLCGAEMLDDKTGPKKLLKFEEIPIEEEVLAQEKVESAEAIIEEYWIK